jgi:uncharacterized protein (TIGR02231 family)
MADGDGIDAPVTGVTVFRNGARVTRTGTVEVRAGLRPVLIGVLPESADPASVRVAVRGSGLALLEVEVRERFRADPLREEVMRLRTELEELRDGLKALADEEAAEQAGLGFLDHLSEAAATALARAVGAGRAGYDELSRMAGHLSAGTLNALERRRDIAARERAARRELDAAQERLAVAERRANRPARYVEVSAVIETHDNATAEVALSYHVSGASWRPLYDVALSGERVTVSYLAEVAQKTGEDWPETSLVLSTARRGVYQALPELRPWYIDRETATPVAGGVMRAMTPKMPRAAGGAGDLGAAPSAAAASGSATEEAEPLAAEVSYPNDAGAGIVYTVARPLAVPADGNPHKTLVARFDADAVLDYLTVPVLAPEAYLRATVTNGSLLLLPGPARVFHGTQFVGETALETVAAGEEFEVQLGVDDQIRVERKLRRRATSKAVIGGARTIDVAYQITVENHRDGKARISVHDHIPLSRDGEIKVRVRETSPPPAAQDDLGELTWDLTLEGGGSATIRHRFTVEHPASVAVTGL